MINTNPPVPSERPNLDDALVEWLEIAETGVVPDETAFLRRHAHLADELKIHLANWKAVREYAPPMIAPGTDTRVETQTQRPEWTMPRLMKAWTSRAPGRVPEIPDYEVDSELGRGGMGIVYRARQVSLDRWVAIKVLRDRGDQDAARFQNEASIAAQLDHPHIVPIYEIGVHHDQHYFAMKWMEGGSLSQVVSRKKKAVTKDAQREAARLVATIARAVHHAHQRGVLHRDLKPSNVLIDAAGAPHVTDFGLAKRLDADSGMTRTGELVGTPSYMAPEQASSRKLPITTATDVYGLGGILYALLTGRPPFQEETTLHTLDQVREREPQTPSSINAALDRDLQTICLKCLDKDPRRRYVSADALADDLDRWLIGAPIEARPTANVERVGKWVRRYPAAAALIAVSVLAVFGMIVGLAVYNHNIGKALKDARDAKDVAVKRVKETRQLLYIADLQAARQHWEAGDDASALDRLERHVPKDDEEDLRGFAWRHLQSTCSYAPHVVGKHDAAVLSLAVSPDERWLATGDSKGGVKIWELATGAPIQSLCADKNEVTTLRFSPDSRTLAIGGGSFRIRLVDTANWKTKTELMGFWNTTRSLAFSRDGGSVAGSFADDKIRIWAPGKKFLVPVTTLRGHKGQVSSLDWSADGKQILSAGNDGTLRVWDAKSEREVLQITAAQESTILTAAFHPHRPLLASGGYDRWLRIWDVATRTEWTAHDTRGSVRSLAFAPDGRQLASVGGNGMICLLELPTAWRGHRVRRVFHDGESTLRAVSFLRQGRSLVTGSESGEVKIWDVAAMSGMESQVVAGGHLDGIAADARRAFVTGPGWKVHIQDLQTGEKIGTLSEAREFRVAPAWTPSGRLLANVSNHGNVRLWDLSAMPAKLRPVDCKGNVNSLALSSDEQLLATGESTGALRIWNTRTGALVKMFRDGDAKPADKSYKLLFSADGKTLFAALTEGAEIEIWDVASGKMRTSLRHGQNTVHALAVSRDGKHLAAGVGQRGLQIWDLHAGVMRATLSGYVKPVSGLEFSPNSNLLVSTNADGTVKLWNVPTFQLLYALHACRLEPGAVVFASDGRTLSVSTNNASAAEYLTWKLPADGG